MSNVGERSVGISNYSIDFTDVNAGFGIDDNGFKGWRGTGKRYQKPSFMTF